MVRSEKASHSKLKKALKTLLAESELSTQSEIVNALKSEGYDNVSQSKVSRILTSLGVIRTRNTRQKIIYFLPKVPGIPTPNSSLSDSVVDIKHNFSIVVIKTAPGAAQSVARLVDLQGVPAGILGCVGGNDTVFIAPARNVRAERLCESIKVLLSFPETTQQQSDVTHR